MGSHKFGLIIAGSVFCSSLVFAKIIDSTAVTVGNQPILASELEKMTRELAGGRDLASLPQEEQKALRQKALETLEEEALLRSEGKKLGFEVSQKQIDETKKNVMSRYGWTEAQFNAALQAQGLTLQKYEDLLRRQLLKLNIVQAKVKGRTQVTQQDVEVRYKQLYGNAPAEVKLHLYQLLFKIEPDAKPALVQAIRRKAEDIRAKIRSASDMKSLAKDSKLKASYSDLGFVQKGELDQAFEKAAFSTDEGKTTPPIRTPDSWRILFVKEKSVVDKIPLEKVEKDLHNKLEEEEVERAFRQYIDELRASALIQIHNEANQ